MHAYLLAMWVLFLDAAHTMTPVVPGDSTPFLPFGGPGLGRSRRLVAALLASGRLPQSKER